MDTFNEVSQNIESRRPGLWIVESRCNGRAHLSAVEFVRDATTYEAVYRITFTSAAAKVRKVEMADMNGALEFCRLRALTAH